jgi:hypothetical protein
MTDNRFYIYLLVDPRNDFPFYVGKGTGYRANSHLTEAKQPVVRWTNRLKCERIQSIWRTGLSVIVTKLHTNLSEEAAYKYESQIILQYGLLVTNTGILTNIRQGGEHSNKKSTGKTKSVTQYSMDGMPLNQYPNAASAAIQNNMRNSGILACCKRTQNYAGGFRWTYTGDVLHPMAACEYHEQNKRPVNQYTTDLVFVQQFSSITAAVDSVGSNSGNISRCCSGHSKTTGGFIWQYA